jgi:hypothetical protein
MTINFLSLLILSQHLNAIFKSFGANMKATIILNNKYEQTQQTWILFYIYESTN